MDMRKICKFPSRKGCLVFILSIYYCSTFIRLYFLFFFISVWSFSSSFLLLLQEPQHGQDKGDSAATYSMNVDYFTVAYRLYTTERLFCILFVTATFVDLKRSGCPALASVLLFNSLHQLY